MLSLEDSTLLADFAEEEIKQPSPRKVINQSRTIYQSRRFRRPSKGRSYGLPVLCDFGEARIGDVQKSSPFVQPHIYRAPEIIFQMKWGSAADIWNLGHHMFEDIFDSNGKHDPFKHLSLMIALIGNPPGDFVRRSETTSQCFDHSGAWIAHDDAIVPSISLEELELRLSGSEKTAFLGFLRSMLKWLPEERKTAKQLLDDPWLQ
nr:putative serine/threonine-protein kinase sky1 [Quercus suber]